MVENKTTNRRFRVLLPLGEREKEILRAGGLLNLTKKQAESE